MDESQHMNLEQHIIRNKEFTIEHDIPIVNQISIQWHLAIQVYLCFHFIHLGFTTINVRHLMGICKQTCSTGKKTSGGKNQNKELFGLGVHMVFKYLSLFDASGKCPLSVLTLLQRIVGNR